MLVAPSMAEADISVNTPAQAPIRRFVCGAPGAAVSGESGGARAAALAKLVSAHHFGAAGACVLDGHARRGSGKGGPEADLARSPGPTYGPGSHSA
jgi:hypothetical protein